MMEKFKWNPTTNIIIAPDGTEISPTTMQIYRTYPSPKFGHNRRVHPERGAVRTMVWFAWGGYHWYGNVKGKTEISCQRLREINP